MLLPNVFIHEYFNLFPTDKNLISLVSNIIIWFPVSVINKVMFNKTSQNINSQNFLPPIQYSIHQAYTLKYIGLLFRTYTINTSLITTCFPKKRNWLGYHHVLYSFSPSLFKEHNYQPFPFVSITQKSSVMTTQMSMPIMAKLFQNQYKYVQDKTQVTSYNNSTVENKQLFYF